MTQKYFRRIVMISLLMGGSFFSAAVHGQVKTVKGQADVNGRSTVTKQMTLNGKVTIIRQDRLEITIDQRLRTRVRLAAPGAEPLMTGFSASETLETKYYSARDFLLVRKDSQAIRDAAGAGRLYRFFGKDGAHQLEKVLSIRVYDSFPDLAIYRVAYVNHSGRVVMVKKWVNHGYDVLAPLL